MDGMTSDPNPAHDLSPQAPERGSPEYATLAADDASRDSRIAAVDAHYEGRGDPGDVLAGTGIYEIPKTEGTVASTEKVDDRKILDLKPIEALVECDREIERIEDELEKAKEKRDKLAELCRTSFAAAGLRSVPLTDAAGYPCSAHLAHKFIVNKREEVTSEMAIEQLNAAGLGWMVKPAYAAATLKSWIIEQLGLENEIPKGITDSFVLMAIDEVRVIRTSRKESQQAKAARHLRKLKLEPKK